MINLKGYNFLFGKKAVSPVIGTILMVAVTVIMAAIVGGFVYQTARPKIPPAVSTSLADDPLVAVSSSYDPGTLTYGRRVAKLYFEGGQNIAPAELSTMVTYMTDNTTAPVETIAILDGASWLNSSGVAVAKPGTLMLVSGTSGLLWMQFVDSDTSGDVTPGDRLDFFETDGHTGGEGVQPGTDFTVKILHKATQAFVADHTIRVY